MLAGKITSNHYLELVKQRGNLTIPLLRGISIGLFIGFIYVLIKTLYAKVLDSGSAVLDMISDQQPQLSLFTDIFLNIGLLLFLVTGVCVLAFSWDKYLATRQKRSIIMATAPGWNTGDAVIGVNSKGLSGRFAHGAFMTPWKMVSGIKETRNVFALVAPGGFTVIPRRFFASDVEYDTVKSYAKAKAEENKKNAAVETTLPLPAAIADHDLNLDPDQYTILRDLSFQLNSVDQKIATERAALKLHGRVLVNMQKVLQSKALVWTVICALAYGLVMNVAMQIRFGYISLFGPFIFSVILGSLVWLNRKRLLMPKTAYEKYGYQQTDLYSDPHRLCLTEEGIFYVTPAGTQFLKWAAVRGIEQNDGAYYIMPTRASGIALPRMAFDTKDHEDDFVTVLNDRVREARKKRISLHEVGKSGSATNLPENVVPIDRQLH